MSENDGKLCGSCRFFVVDKNDPMKGDCHRNPVYIKGKHAVEDWCGRWKRIKFGAAFREETTT